MVRESLSVFKCSRETTYQPRNINAMIDAAIVEFRNWHVVVCITVVFAVSAVILPDARMR